MILDHKYGHSGPQLDPKKETGRLIASRPFSFQINRLGIRFEILNNNFPKLGRGFDPHGLCPISPSYEQLAARAVPQASFMRKGEKV